MEYDLTAMKAIMENDKFAIYVLEELKKKNTFKGVRLNKANNSQTEVYLEKTNKIYPPYRVIGFVNGCQR